MARLTSSMVTWTDINYMIENEGFEEGLVEESSERIVTKDKVLLALNPDPTLISSYANNQAVPYGKIKNYLHTSPESIDFNSSSGTISITLYVPDGHAWTLSETLSWITTSLSSGTGTTTLNITRLANLGVSRSGSIVFTDSVTTDTFTFNITQEANANEEISLFSSATEGAICTSTTSGTYYIEFGLGFAGTTKLYTNAAGTIFAPANYYIQGIGDWRYWNGTAFTTTGSCGF